MGRVKSYSIYTDCLFLRDIRDKNGNKNAFVLHFRVKSIEWSLWQSNASIKKEKVNAIANHNANCYRLNYSIKHFAFNRIVQILVTKEVEYLGRICISQLQAIKNTYKK